MSRPGGGSPRKSSADHRRECRGYVRALADFQVENVLALERKRARDNKGTDTGRVARIFADEAQRELERRGLR